MQSLWIPGWFPARLNELVGHRMKAARLKKKDRGNVATAYHVYNIRPATGPRRVDLHCVMAPGVRAWDGDSLWKSCLDALVSCGALFDDSPRLCRPGRVTYSRALHDAPPGTLILLEDLT